MPAKAPARHRRILAPLLSVLTFGLLSLPSTSSGFGGPPASGSPNTVPYRTMTTANNVLIIPVQFPGGAVNPLDQTAGTAALNEMDTWVRGVSYGTFGFTTKTVTTVISMPQAKSFYTTNGFNTLLTDARNAALAANASWNFANFEFYVVVAESGTLPDAGQANLGNKGMWLPNSVSEPFPKSSFAHELAHNLGLNHAGLWIRPSGGTDPIAATGTFQDYGSLFDPVGLAGYDRHYSAHYKHLLGWIPAANIATVDSTTTSNVRIYAHDGGSLNPARKYAIRIPASVSDAANPGSRDVWLETRTIFNPGIPVGSRDGLIVQWGDQKGSPQGSCLIDTTPNSLTPNNTINDFADALLPVGTTFSDPWQAPVGSNRITVTPIASGGSGADKWVDVAITTPNADLSALTISAGALSPAFSSSTSSYDVTAIGATSTTVTATGGAGATIELRINGGAFSPLTSGTPSSALTLVGGVNVIDVKVTNGGWTKTYSTNVATLVTFPAVAGSLGAIPDNSPSSTVEGSPRDVQFNVSGLSGTLSSVVVNFTLSPAHTWGSDLTVRLIAPDGTTKHTVMSLAHIDDNTDLAGPYTFADDASGLISTALTSVASANAPAAPGRYRTQSNSETATAILPSFAALSGAALNGTWTLRFADRFSGDSGTVSAANLSLNATGSGPTVTAPTVTTATQTGVTTTSATLGGNVTADGGASVSDRGIVWATTAAPTILNNKVAMGSGTGTFSSTVTGLPASTLIYVRAYATNTSGTSYGSQISFTTLGTSADLSALTTTAGALTPPFATGITSYSVSASTASTTVTPTVAQAGSTVQVRVNGGAYAAVASGSPSAALPLNVGTNTIDIKVTAEDGTTVKTYTVAVTRPFSGSTTTAGTNVGQVPDLGVREILFNVSGSVGPVSNVTAEFTMNPIHTFIGDLNIQLIAPDGTTASVMSWSSVMTGQDVDCAGPYLISDAGTTGLAQSVAGVGANNPVPAGTYRAANLNTLVSLANTFGGKAPNGTWKLRFADSATGDIGSVSSASLNVITRPVPGTQTVAVQPGGSVQISIQGASPDVGFTLQRTTDFIQWSNLQVIVPGAGGTASFTDSNPPPGKAFYRLAY